MFSDCNFFNTVFSSHLFFPRVEIFLSTIFATQRIIKQAKFSHVRPTCPVRKCLNALAYVPTAETVSPLSSKSQDRGCLAHKTDPEVMLGPGCTTLPKRVHSELSRRKAKPKPPFHYQIHVTALLVTKLRLDSNFVAHVIQFASIPPEFLQDAPT